MSFWLSLTCAAICSSSTKKTNAARTANVIIAMPMFLPDFLAPVFARTGKCYLVNLHAFDRDQLVAARRLLLPFKLPLSELLELRIKELTNTFYRGDFTTGLTIASGKPSPTEGL
jgi:hypothetical protein